MKKIYLSFSLLLALSMSLSAQVYVKSDASGTNNGSSWANAYTSLQTALTNTTSGAVWVAAGTYKPSSASASFTVPGGVSIYGGFVGTETSLGQRNPITNVTRLSGDIDGNDIAGNFATGRADNAAHVVSVAAAQTAAAVIDGFTIAGGNTATGTGGGVFAESTVTVRNCNLNNNYANFGSAIYLATPAANSQILSSELSGNLGVGALYLNAVATVDVDSCSFNANTNNIGTTNASAIFILNSTNVTLSNSELTGNSAPRAGALYYDTDGLPNVTNADNFVVTNCLFLNNINTSAATPLGVGGAMRCVNGSYSLINCTFDGSNSVSSGGHIRNDIQATDNVVYQDCIFKNAISGGWGGAFTAYGGTFTVTGCHFEANTCTRLGGAVNNGFAGTMTYTDCTFLNNSAAGTASGGALASQNDLTAVNVHNCSFVGNSSTGNGGAIFSGAADSSSPYNISDCEFVGNVSDGVGGAISIADNGPNNDATLTITNSIFNYNTANEQGGAINLGDANTTITSCLFTYNEAVAGTTAPTGRGGAISINVDSTTLDVTIMNSTFAYNIGEYAAAISNWTGAEDVSFSTTVLQNNIFAQDGLPNYAIEAGVPTVTSNGGNLFDDDSFDAILTHPKDLKVNDISGLFVNPDDDDYHLLDDAVARDKGVSAGAPTLDLDGNPRVGPVDMGAYENQNPSKANEVLLDNNGMLTLAPNPANGQTTTLTLDNQWSGTVELRLINTIGQTVKTFKMNKQTGKTSYDLSLIGLGKGIYQVTASNGSQVVVQQLVRN